MILPAGMCRSSFREFTGSDNMIIMAVPKYLQYTSRSPPCSGSLMYANVRNLPFFWERYRTLYRTTGCAMRSTLATHLHAAAAALSTKRCMYQYWYCHFDDDEMLIAMSSQSCRCQFVYQVPGIWYRAKQQQCLGLAHQQAPAISAPLQQQCPPRRATAAKAIKYTNI